ncbi:MAG: tetratricopeptide repeat protein [Leptolyngbya sp. Prado105]|nr:tetratricopeptide repeat protein [Leptolyngbya sp. Prado105]
MKRIVLVHHHIFKNAGTSFNHALEKAFGDRFLEYDLPGSQVVTTARLADFIQEHPEALAVSGHHIALPTPQSDALQTLSTVLIRKPLARVRSIYEFERKQNAQTEGAVMAKQLDFKAFVAWRLDTSPHVFCNYQVLYCSRTDNLVGKYAPTEQDLELALENLKGCLAVGTVERYSEFLMMAQYALDAYHSGIVLKNLHLNVTAKPAAAAEPRMSTRDKLLEELGADLVQQLEEQNQLDTRLYEFANQQVDNWLAEQGEAKARYFDIKGTTFLGQRNFQDARGAFQSAATVKPLWFKPYYGLASVAEKLGDSDTAIANYRQAIELDPSFAWAYFELGNIFYKQEIFEEAIEYYRQAIEVHPVEKSFAFHMKLGDALMKTSQISEAIETYQTADQINPDSVDVKLKLSSAYLQSENWQQSEDFAMKACQLAPENCDVYLNLGDIFLAKKENHKAAEYYRKGVEINAQHPGCLEGLKQVALGEGAVWQH